jgi:hypothetical protein
MGAKVCPATGFGMGMVWTSFGNKNLFLSVSLLV